MTLDYSAWRFWIDIGHTCLTLALGGYVWVDKRQVKTTERFSKLETWQTEHAPAIKTLIEAEAKREAGCEKHKERTEKLELDQKEMQIDIRHLPSRQDLADLSKQIGGLTEKLGTLDGRLTGINRAVDLLNQHHLRISE